jgi:hypothetical protein
MKRSTFFSLAVFIFYFTISEPLNAQKKTAHDSTYYETFPEKMTVRVYLSQKYIHLNFPSHIKDEPDLEYKANPKLNLGAGFTYKNFSFNIFNGFGFLNNYNEPKGKTSGLSLQLHVYPRKWAVDLLAAFPKGYHLNKGEAGVGADNYYYRADVKTSYLGLSAFRVPNKEKFSYRAALLQTEWQKKSAGSFLFGGEAYYGLIQGDSALVPTVLADKYPQAGMTSLKFFSFGPGVGYAYTLVIHKHFFMTGSFIGNLDMNITSESDDSKKQNQVSFNPADVFKFALGYNSSNWNVSTSWTGQGIWMQGASSSKDYFFPSGHMRVVFAHRFTIHKHHNA